MGYGNKDLEEVETERLHKELARRERCHRENICPYCSTKLDNKLHKCKYANDLKPISHQYR